MTEPQAEAPTPTPNRLQALFSDWRLKFAVIGGAIGAVILGLFLLNFFWQHNIASMGMRSWSARADANPIECMIQDTNNDGYVSCTAMLQGEVVPLECGASIFNMGCRVNYGAAAPPTVRGNKSRIPGG
ncbi:hypothetical protein [[Phormidium] sp. ETS-05]|uniref:hypothetical protein n=1 Tax=[Phormidium] sp. ETS-05 TaxID=222819 RepID=UPI001E523D0E|nr:hypothetical protein [[Phormidium] sp. ETS-05]